MNRPFNENMIKVKQEVTSKKPHDEIRISNHFRTDYLSLSSNPDNLVDIPIMALRVIFKIVSDLRFSQYQTSKEYQFSLFEDLFKTENNTYAAFSFKEREILGSSNNIESLKSSLEFLVDYKKQWYVSKNSNGKNVSTYGGLILNPSVIEGNVSFLLSSYWMEKIIDVKDYNDSLYNIVFKLKSSKQVLFYLWTLCIKPGGTAVNFETINTRFQLNYKEAKSLAKHFIKPMKILFDMYSATGFNFSVQGDKISFITYHNANKSIAIEEGTLLKVKIKAKVQYWKRRHKLSLEQSKQITKIINSDSKILNLLIDAYNVFISACKKYKLAPVDSVGVPFLELFQGYIKEEIKKNGIKKEFSII